MKRLMFFAFGLLAVGFAVAAELSDFVQGTEIVLQARPAKGHLQDVCFDGKGTLYWAHTKEIYKTDLFGRVLAKVDVEGHHAGLEVRGNRLFVAVCPMQGTTGGKTTSECRVTVGEYDAETLSLVKMHETDLNDRAGSLAILADGTFLVGCLRPQDIATTQVRFHHLDADFKLIRSHVLDNIPVKLGVEVIKRVGNDFYLDVYGVDADNKPLGYDAIRIDADLRECGRGKLGGATGLVIDGDFVWTGWTRCDPETKTYTSKLVRRIRPAWTHPADKVGFRLDEDFSVTDARGGAYGIAPLRDTALSHRHGWVEDGAYRIPVEGNRHVIAAPRLRDFWLEADYSLVEFKRLDLTMGFKVFFRHDVATKRGHELAVYFDHDLKLHFELADGGGADGVRALPRELRVVQCKKGMKLDDLHLTLSVNGSKGTVATLGETVDFTLPAEGPADGKVAFDQTQNEGVKFILKKLALTSPDALPTTPVGRWHFALPQSQGSPAAPVFDVAADRYASGEVAVRVALSGCLAGRAARLDTKGFAWSSLGERITAPYVKFTLPGGDETKLCLWNGRRHFRDPFKVKNALPCAWPCERTFVLEALPKEFLVAAGYEKFMTHPHRFAANGPYEQVRTQADEVVHTGEALGPDVVAFAAASPADKKIVSKIPADLPFRERALKHAREQHYFFESELPRFTLTTVYRRDDFSADEVKVEPRVETVFGDAAGVEVVEEGGTEDLRALPGGYVRVTKGFRLSKNPGVGVWHLETRIGAEPRVRTERTVFEVLSDDPNGPCPPLASGLPEFLSIPNEIKYLEESAFDPWSDLGGVSHYYSIDLRYPAIAEKFHSWEGDRLYRRKCLIDGGGRNAANVDQSCEENRIHMRWADYYNCLPNETHREGRFDFAQARTYVGEQLQILKDWLAARHYTLKSLLPEELAARKTDFASVSGNRGIPDAALEEIFNLGWDDFKAFARPRVADYIRKFDEYLLSVNPKIARATYGPFHIYVAANKTPYCLDYAGYPLDVDPRLVANGSFWIFEDYHYSCDYPLYRPAFFAAAYKLLYPNSRRLFPEIYYEGWGRCADGAVYQAHPDKYPKLAPSHQRRIAYQYGFGTPYLRDDGTYGYWTDDGFHARNPEREAMNEFVYAWGNLVRNRPAKPLKSPYVIVDLDAFRRFGDRFEKGGAFRLDSPTLKDVRSDIVNLAEESVAYAYERCCAAGYATPVVMTLGALDRLTPENCEFAILPPLVKSTPPEIVAAVRRAIVRGVRFLGFIEAAGLEKELAAFYPKAPTLAGRETFAGRFERGREAVDPQTAAEVTALFAKLAPAPAVRATRGTVMACESKAGDTVVVLSDESPLYGDTAQYPATLRFTVSRPGIGKAEIIADAPYAVVSRTDDRLVIRTETDKDTALFFRFK